MKNDMIRRFGPLEIDLATYRVFLQGRLLALPYKEYALLVYLSARVGKVVSKRELITQVCGRHDLGGVRKLDELIRHLRIQIERSGVEFIRRVEDQGYEFLGAA